MNNISIILCFINVFLFQESLAQNTHSKEHEPIKYGVCRQNMQWLNSSEVDGIVTNIKNTGINFVRIFRR